MVTGYQIRQARKRAGLSQAKLASLVGVAERTIGGWEREETAPGIAEPKLLDVLATYLGHDMPVGDGLEEATDDELLAEIARRFARSHHDSSTGTPATTSEPDAARERREQDVLEEALASELKLDKNVVRPDAER